MKLRIINKLSQRAASRFKWMCIATIAITAINVFADRQWSNFQPFSFVEADLDKQFEHDDIYSEYIQSARIQQDLRGREQRQGHQAWSIDQFIQQKERNLAQVTKVWEDMNKGVEGWHENVPNQKFENMPVPSKVKYNGQDMYHFKGKYFEEYVKQVQTQGYVEEYWSEQRCFASLINVPGIQLLPNGLMGFFYLLFLGYLFMGINIAADIFMEAIEVITSKTIKINVMDHEEGTNHEIEVPIWNPTMANLTLMAFGSSAPEIIISVLEALKDLGEPAGDLGPSTIVGSAAFNLLVISGVSIYAVGGNTGEVKKIDDMGVFLTTAVFSVFAYVWLYICLAINSEGEVTIVEAFLTLLYFFILLVLAFCADKYNQMKRARIDHDNTVRDKQRKMKKTRLRSIAKSKGEASVLAAAQGQTRENMSEDDVKEIRALYIDILAVEDLQQATLEQLMEVLKPESLFERFAARKANQLGATKEFMDIKGKKYQIENEQTFTPMEVNRQLAFKCLHYSVTESAGTCSVTIIKKNPNDDCIFGLRTIDGTASAGKEYEHVDVIHQINKKEQEKTIQITIMDNADWQPDLDFYIELYDTKSQNKLFGDDTQCKITILDEDFPGKLGFDNTDVSASRSQETVAIVINRIEGTDGKVSCMIKTEPMLLDPNNPVNAVEFEDYLPRHEKVEFAAGESKKIIQIGLVPENAAKEAKSKEVTTAMIDNPDGDEDEDQGKCFKVLLEKIENDPVKISRKNCCTIELTKSQEQQSQNKTQTNLINYFVQQKKPSYSAQFKNAVMLCPSVDEDDLIVEDVDLMEALSHFATIGWKLIFALIPPVEWGGGLPAFLIALVFIGVITAIVAEVAGVLGCALGLKEAVTAITLVAVGTSLPDTLASMTAARNSEYADSAIGNVTGSNSVNVFVGLGLPWVISALYASSNNKKYETPPGNLAFSVMLFLITSICCFILLGLRRYLIGGELGGSKLTRLLSCIFCCSLWLIYVIFSSMRAYGTI